MGLTESELKRRSQYVGASEAAAALGMSPWYTPLELYRSKKDRMARAIEETLPMQVGVALEPIVLSHFEREHGVTVIDRQREFVDPKAPWRRCHVDGIVKGGRDFEIVEAKTSGDYRGWGEDGSDEVPVPYLYNACHSLACCPEAVSVVFPTLVGGRDFRVYRVPRNGELIDLVKGGVDQFWLHFVKKDIEPPATNNDDLKLLYPRSQGKPIIVSERIEKLCAELKRVKATKKEAEKAEEKLGFEVRNYMGEFDTLTDGSGKVLATWKSQVRETIDVKALRENEPMIAARFTRETPARTLLIK